MVNYLAQRNACDARYLFDGGLHRDFRGGWWRWLWSIKINLIKFKSFGFWHVERARCDGLN